MDNITFVLSRFHPALNVLGQTSDPKINRDLIKTYSSSDRHYHNLSHIVSMLKWVEDFRTELSEQDAAILDLAIIYHDYIDPTFYQAEYLSALIFEHHFKYLFNGYINSQFDIISNEVCLLIGATALHFMKSSAKDHFIRFRPLAALILDADLHQLAEDDWRQTSKNIRDEYYLVSDEDYLIGRRDILNKMLSMPNLYYTDKGKLLETKARENIQAQIDALS